MKRNDTRTLSRLSHEAVREAVQRGNVTEVAAIVDALTPEGQPAPVTAAQLANARVEDPEAYQQATHLFSQRFFQHHDDRRGKGQSPFNRSVGD